MSATPPKDVYIGMVDGQWPIQAFTEQQHAIRWMQEEEHVHGDGRVHLWLCRLEVQHELTVLPPAAPRLVPRYNADEAVER